MIAKNLKWILYISLVLIWGSSFILIKKGLEVFDPVQVGSIRLIISFLALLPFVYKRFSIISTKDWLIIGTVGLLGSFFPAYLFAIAQTGLDSSTAGILNSLTPLFTLLMGVSFFKFKARWWSYAGVFISMLGTYGLLTVSGGNAFSFNIKYGIMIIFATLFYGTQINIIKTYLKHIPPLTITVFQFFIIGWPAIFVLFGFTDFIELFQTEPRIYEGLFYVGMLALFGTALALILFNKLIKIAIPVFVSSVTYFIPIVALIWGFYDNESFNLLFFLWIGLILSGVYLVNKK
ncbi:MAG: DMT family transporter [Bacteroidales bacterium]|jgi:drug/metabolite transporter (DMT)-like permease|nr:DMT family transporter [Bacteroidales bacterium]